MRRSKRVRIPPTDFWRNELPDYQLDENGHRILVGVQAGFVDDPYLVTSMILKKAKKKKQKNPLATKGSSSQGLSSPLPQTFPLVKGKRGRKKKNVNENLKQTKEGSPQRVLPIIVVEPLPQSSLPSKDDKDRSKRKKKRKQEEDQIEEKEIHEQEEETPPHFSVNEDPCFHKNPSDEQGSPILKKRKTRSKNLKTSKVLSEENEKVQPNSQKTTIEEPHSSRHTTENQDRANIKKRRKQDEDQIVEKEMPEQKVEAPPQAHFSVIENPFSHKQPSNEQEVLASPGTSLPKKSSELKVGESFKVVLNTTLSSLRNQKTEIFRPYNALTWVYPSKDKSFTSYRVAKYLIHSVYSLGILELRPHAVKPSQHLPSETLIYMIESGNLQVQVDDIQYNSLGPKDTFIVPAGNAYALKNLTEEEARIFFITIKEPEPPVT